MKKTADVGENDGDNDDDGEDVGLYIRLLLLLLLLMADVGAVADVVLPTNESTGVVWYAKQETDATIKAVVAAFIVLLVFNFVFVNCRFNDRPLFGGDSSWVIVVFTVIDFIVCLAS